MEDNYFNYHLHDAGIWVNDSVRIIKRTFIPPVYKPVTWAERMQEKLSDQWIENRRKRNKWIVYPLAFIGALVIPILLISLIFIIHYYQPNVSPHSFSTFGYAIAFGSIVGWLWTKDKLENYFPIEYGIHYKKKKNGKRK